MSVRTRYKDYAYSYDADTDVCKVITPDGEQAYTNPIEGFNVFFGCMQFDFLHQLREELERGGRNPLTGAKDGD